VHVPQNGGGQISGTIGATVDCLVEQNGNNIIIAVTITPTSVPNNLNQVMGTSPVTFNFAGTISGTQINANANGNAGPNGGPTFNFNLSGTLTSNAFTFTISSASDSQLSVSTQQQITLQATH